MSEEAGDELVLVLTTTPARPAAESLARRLVDERRIACASLVAGVGSVYRWEGAVRHEEEVLVVMKTVASEVERLFERIAELHPYDVPELIAVPVAAASQAYCRWVRQETIEVSA
jgi:periplasmic divalent cation tolerance protein